MSEASITSSLYSVAGTDHSHSLPADPTDRDLAALRQMQARLYSHVRQSAGVAASTAQGLLYLHEPEGRQHRVVLLNPGELQHSADLTFVGFFGQKRPEADTGALDALDIELIQELYGFPHFLSYSSLELADGSWGNLVLMSSPEGIAHWASSARHAFAARELAPNCYTTIRLHIGVISSAGQPDAALRIQRTKHFEYAFPAC